MPATKPDWVLLFLGIARVFLGSPKHRELLQQPCLKLAKFFLGQLRLFKDAAKRSRWDVLGVHRDVRLSAVRMAQDDVRS
jgi:hypothetical protein